MAGLGTIALLGTAAQSASAAPAPTSSASAVRATPSKATSPARPASASGLNCTYTVTTNTVLVTATGQQPLMEGDILWGPQPAPGSSAYLYSYVYDEWGYVWTGALFEEYCDE
ncbi:MAG: hypothetical protein ACRDN0_33825 [Trebonia sp.]